MASISGAQVCDGAAVAAPWLGCADGATVGKAVAAPGAPAIGDRGLNVQAGKADGVQAATAAAAAPTADPLMNLRLVTAGMTASGRF